MGFLWVECLDLDKALENAFWEILNQFAINVAEWILYIWLCLW